MMTELINFTLSTYGDVGIYDPKKLAELDFLNQPELLINLVTQSNERASRRSGRNKHMALITEITSEWMQYMIDRKFPPLTPHHTQAFTVMMMVRCFEEYLGRTARNQQGGSKLRVQAFIAQLATGEGKSIVIAMLAVFMVRLHGLTVHVLENNEGLLERDYKTNAPFYKRFGIVSDIGVNGLNNKDAKIIYCLKKQVNKHFLGRMVEGKLDEELQNIVLIVDEVDDLVVNERPNAHYVKTDVEQTPDLQACYTKLRDGWSLEVEQDPPEGIDHNFWIRACSVVRYCEDHIQEGTHYRVIKGEDDRDEVIMLDDKGNVPKVPLAAPWLQYMNYKLCGKDPLAQSRYACVCTPYIFNKYAGIFGLTGSVGGKEELKYLTDTYSAVKFDVPRFLDTCIGNARKVVKNHGVELHDDEAALTTRVVQLCREYYRQVPVLVIASSTEQTSSLCASIRADGTIPSDEVQRFTEFDEQGRSLKEEWATIVEDSTKRLGGAKDSRCRVTVTDRFGGRGHDFQVVDKENNTNGGMLVIATSIPDEREWIQWKGRTARQVWCEERRTHESWIWPRCILWSAHPSFLISRQDRPGQYYVVLNKKAAPFSLPEHAKLAAKARQHSPAKLARPSC